jgi:hypothetical protein
LRRIPAIVSFLNPNHGVSAEWRQIPRGADADPAVHARYADLAILGQLDPDSGEPDMI